MPVEHVLDTRRMDVWSVMYGTHTLLLTNRTNRDGAWHSCQGVFRPGLFFPNTDRLVAHDPRPDGRHVHVFGRSRLLAPLMCRAPAVQLAMAGLSDAVTACLRAGGLGVRSATGVVWEPTCVGVS